MGLWVKRSGTWVEANSVWSRQAGIWKELDSVYVKRSGVWTGALLPPDTVPSAPILSLEVIGNNWIRVGARYPGTANNEDVRMIRVLAMREPPGPTTYLGDGFIHQPQNAYPNEAWSTRTYGPDNPGKDTSVVINKSFPVNADETTRLPGGQWYYFAAWTMDKRNRWSEGIHSAIWMPKNDQPVTGIMHKEAVFAPNAAGTISGGALDQSLVSPTAAANDLQVMPVGVTSVGMWFHGNKITESVGANGPATISSATIRLSRDQDEFQPSANVWLLWHDVASPAIVPPGNRFNMTKVGVISKGESKTFTIPTPFHSHLGNDIKGFGLGYDSTSVSDKIRVKGPERDFRSGEVHLVWTEQT